MYKIKFGDLFNTMDRGCGDITVFKEYDNCVLFTTAHNSCADNNLSKVKDMLVVQISNDNGDEWRIYVREE